jgi:ubiquinone/menaquinone biosynthesis C-methylase UbiE
MKKLELDQRENWKKIEVVEGYNKWSSTYDRNPNPLIAIEEGITLNMIGNVKNKRILDIGCGTGRYCTLLTKKGGKVIGLDTSSEMLEYAKRKITPTCKFELHLSNIEDAKFPNRYFDIVVSALTLSHIPELEPIAQEISRIIKPRGRLIISDFHPFWPASGHDYTEFFEGEQEYRIPVYTHSFEEYSRLLRKFEFVIKDIREPKIDYRLIQSFPELKSYEGIPLAMILKAVKNS